MTIADDLGGKATKQINQTFAIKQNLYYQGCVYVKMMIQQHLLWTVAIFDTEILFRILGPCWSCDIFPSWSLIVLFLHKFNP